MQMKKKKYQTVRIISSYNRKMVEPEAKSTPLWHVQVTVHYRHHYHTYTWPFTIDTSITRTRDHSLSTPLSHVYVTVHYRHLYHTYTWPFTIDTSITRTRDRSLSHGLEQASTVQICFHTHYHRKGWLDSIHIWKYNIWVSRRL